MYSLGNSYAELGRVLDMLTSFLIWLPQLIQGAIKNPGFAVDENFQRNLSIVDGQIIALFSRESHDAYKKFEVMISSQGTNSPVHEIVEARNQALRALYGEVTGPWFLKAIGR